MRRFKMGFTFIELGLVLAIMSTLTAIATINLSSLQNKTSLDTTLNTLLSDIRQQQLKAMTGDTEGRSTSDSYGVHFDSSRYVLFHGNSYSVSGSTNFAVNLNSNITFTSITFPSSNLIFNQFSGEFYNYAAGSSTVIIRNSTTNDQKTVHFNRYGVITQIN